MGESNSTLAATGFEGFGGFKGRTSLARLVMTTFWGGGLGKVPYESQTTRGGVKMVEK